MASKKIKGIIVEIGGDTSGLTKAISEADKSLKNTESELTAVDKALKLDPSNIKMLTQQQGLLSEAVKETADKLKLLEDNQEKVDKAFAANAKWEKQYEPIRKQIEETEEALKKLKSQQAKYDEQLKSGKISPKKYEEYAKSVEETQKKLNELRKEKKALDSTFEDGHLDASQYREYQREVEITRAKLSALNGRLEESKNAAEKAENVIDNLSNELDDAQKSADNASEGFTVMKGVLANLTADGIERAAGAFKEMLVEGEKASSSFQAQTGASAKEMEAFNEQIDELYSNNYGEGLEDIASAMSTVKQSTKETDPSKIKELTENALALNDVFDFDVNETMRAANMLIDQFGISGDEAFNLIAQGAQNGLNKNGDLLDSINEYAVHYKQLGYNADEFFNSLQNGAAAGTFSVDKLGDAMKEFGIRTKDTAASTTEGFELLGLNADNMRAEFAKGGEAAQEAADKTLKALFEMDDQVKQNQAGVDLFGTMWEDLGISGVKALMDVSGTADKTAKSLEDIKKVKYSDTETEIKGLGRSIKTEILKPLADDALPVVKKGVEWTEKNMPLIKNLIVDIGAAAISWKLTTGIISATNAIKTFTATVKAGESATKAFNLAAGANPYALMITAAIAAGVAVKGYIDDLTDSIDETCDGYDELNDRQKEFVDSCGELNQKISESREEREKNLAGIDAEAEGYKKMVDRLYTLNDAESLTNEQKSEMKTIVEGLNKAIPGLNIAIDQQTGHILNQRDAVDDLVDSYTKQAKAQAAQESLVELYKQQYEAEKKLEEAEDNRAGAYNTLNEAQMKRTKLMWEYNAIHNKQTTATYEEQLAEQELLKQIEALDKEISVSKDKVGEMNTAYTSSKETVRKVNGEISDLNGIIEENSTAADTAADSLTDYGKAASGAADEVSKTFTVSQETFDKISEIANNYADAANNIDETTKGIADSLNIFSAFNWDDELNADEMISNLESNLNAMDWGTNGIDTLKRHADELGVTINENLLAKLEEMGPDAANQLRAMCNMSETELQQYSDLYGKYYAMAQEKATNELKKLRDESAAQLKEIMEQAEGQTVPLSDMYFYLAQCAVGGFEDGVIGSIDVLKAAGREIFFAVEEGYKEASETHSPSRAMRRLARYLPEGVALGIDDEAETAYKSAEDMVNGILAKISDVSRFSALSNSNVIDDIGYINANISNALPKSQTTAYDRGASSKTAAQKQRASENVPETAVINLNIDGQMLAKVVAPFLNIIYGTDISLKSRGVAVK